MAMRRAKGRRVLLPATPSDGSSNSQKSSPLSDQASQQAASQPEFEEMILTFDDGDVDYNQQASASDEGSTSNASTVTKKRSIKSNSSVHLTGPMEIDGSVESMGSISFLGDFAVRKKIEAYGSIVVDGNMTCNERIKAFGNIDITGYVLCGGKVKVFGKLTVTGHFEVTESVEVWGAVVIQGYMKCKKLTAYASVTTIGDESTYEVDEAETIYGARLVRRTENES